MKTYRRVVIALAIIASIGYATFLFTSPVVMAVINNPDTMEQHELLKENAEKVAETLDVSVVSDENLFADFYFRENKLVVTVSSEVAQLTSKMPISLQALNIEDGMVEFYGKIDYENAEYEENALVEPLWWYFIMIFAMAGLVGVGLYLCLYKVWVREKPITSN